MSRGDRYRLPGQRRAKAHLLRGGGSAALDSRWVTWCGQGALVLRRAPDQWRTCPTCEHTRATAADRLAITAERLLAERDALAARVAELEAENARLRAAAADARWSLDPS